MKRNIKNMIINIEININKYFLLFEKINTTYINKTIIIEKNLYFSIILA